MGACGRPSAARHVDVHQRHVRLGLADLADRGVHVVGLTDDLEPSAELGPHSGEEQPVIVYDEEMEVNATLEYDNENTVWLARPDRSSRRDLPYP